MLRVENFPKDHLHACLHERQIERCSQDPYCSSQGVEWLGDTMSTEPEEDEVKFDEVPDTNNGYQQFVLEALWVRITKLADSTHAPSQLLKQKNQLRDLRESAIDPYARAYRNLSRELKADTLDKLSSQLSYMSSHDDKAVTLAVQENRNLMSEMRRELMCESVGWNMLH